MGIALIIVGLLAAGVVVDFAVENDLVGASDRTFALLGGSFSLNETQLVLGAAVLGALAVLSIVLGVGLSRRGRARRRTQKHRIRDLERENADMRAGSARSAWDGRPTSSREGAGGEREAVRSSPSHERD